MNIESRIHLYKDKFGLKSNDQLFYNGLENLFQHARDLIADNELFFSRNCPDDKELWLASDFYIAFFTNPERIQRVQTLTLFTDPVFSSTQRNFCKLGYHTADVLLLA